MQTLQCYCNYYCAYMQTLQYCYIYYTVVFICRHYSVRSKRQTTSYYGVPYSRHYSDDHLAQYTIVTFFGKPMILAQPGGSIVISCWLFLLMVCMAGRSWLQLSYYCCPLHRPPPAAARRFLSCLSACPRPPAGLGAARSHGGWAVLLRLLARSWWLLRTRSEEGGEEERARRRIMIS